jgi:hypothetical protein
MHDESPEILGIDQCILVSPDDVVEPYCIILERLLEWFILSVASRGQISALKGFALLYWK